MAISKQSYTDLKEYWDYQRKIAFNKAAAAARKAARAAKAAKNGHN